MRRIKLLRAAHLFGVLALACVARSAVAQETGTLITHRAAQMDTTGAKSARLTLKQYGACVLDRYKGRAARLMQIAVDSDEYRRLSRAVIEGDGDECLSGGELSFGVPLFHGALFEAAYLRDFRFDAPDTVPADVDSGYQALYMSPYSSAARNAISLEQFGECVVRADTKGARALLLSDPSRPSEQQAFAQLAPSFGGCVVKGETIELSKVVVRGAVAEGLYRLSTAVTAKVKP